MNRSSSTRPAPRPRPHVWLLAPVLGGVLAATGCGPSLGRPEGRVLVGSTPVARAELRFEGTIDGAPTLVTGVSRADGRYVVDTTVHPGVPTGDVTVTVRRAVTLDGQPLPEGEEGMILSRSGKAKQDVRRFQVTIPPGVSPLDFDMARGEAVTP